MPKTIATTSQSISAKWKELKSTRFICSVQSVHQNAKQEYSGGLMSGVCPQNFIEIYLQSCSGIDFEAQNCYVNDRFGGVCCQ